MNRKIIHEIVNSFYESYISVFLTTISNRFNNNGNLGTFINVLKHGFRPFKTKYLTFKYLKSLNCLIEPLLLTINSFLTSRKVELTRKIVLCKQTLCFIPLKINLQKFLKLPKVFDYIISYVEKCKTSNYVTFFNSQF